MTLLALAVDTLAADTPIIEVVVGLTVSGVVGGLAFMLKRAFADVTQSVERLGSKVDSLKDSQHAQDTAKALIERDIERLQMDVEMVRKRDHELISSVTAVLARALDMMPRAKTGEHRAHNPEED